MMVTKYVHRMNDLTKFLIDRNSKLEIELHHCYKRLKQLEESNTDLVTEKWQNSLKDKEIYKDVRDRIEQIYLEHKAERE